MYAFVAILLIFVSGDTWRLNVASPAPLWAELSPTVSPSPRYGFVSGVVGNYWIISHGKSEQFNVTITSFFPLFFQAVILTSATAIPGHWTSQHRIQNGT